MKANGRFILLAQIRLMPKFAIDIMKRQGKKINITYTQLRVC